MAADTRTALAALTAILVFGVGYSVLYDTYLDTSNPLLAHLSHPLAASHYFASKKNILNVYFIKKAWAWTSGAFLLNWITSPSSVRTKERVWQYLITTLSWVLFTSWFFGPALFERLTVASGGECILNFPSGEHVAVPYTLCYSKSTVTPATHPGLFASPQFASFSFDGSSFPAGWNGTPRLRRGHDVSGHIFLLTMSILFLVDQLRPSLYTRKQQGQWSVLHYPAVVANGVLIAFWFLGAYTTSVYFHSPLEKFTGFALGVTCFALTQLPFVKIRLPEEGKLHTN
ncbi:hypothetical protein AX15_006793 [Amanita polypyramis BW_CC]|nr:hypothetical protein AX15_006793 [Amanita polypyramis BW_CC]